MSKKKSQKRLIDIFSKFSPFREAPKEEPAPVDMEGIDDEFFQRINAFFKSNNIHILSHEILRRGSDIEFIIRVPSVIGQIEYFCKAKNKKKSNDGDLSSAYIQGQSKKLPTLYITTGEVTKKAESMLEKDFRGMIMKVL
ncbi:hypothetical protein JW968_07460 [Candidatus Woesearchaeota archaeon]|nr:hypothetical protein [Candidatus Woesearchaeota archaeon]